MGPKKLLNFLGCYNLALQLKKKEKEKRKEKVKWRYAPLKKKRKEAECLLRGTEKKRKKKKKKRERRRRRSKPLVPQEEKLRSTKIQRSDLQSVFENVILALGSMSLPIVLR